MKKEKVDICENAKEQLDMVHFTKRLITSAFFFLLVILFTRGVLEGKTTTSNQNGIPIEIKPGQSNPGGGPRSLSIVPFAAYQWSDYVVLFCSDDSVGTVQVELVSTAGDDYCIDFYTENGTILLPISGEAGHYTMILVTEIGLAFEGEFDL